MSLAVTYIQGNEQYRYIQGIFCINLNSLGVELMTLMLLALFSLELCEHIEINTVRGSNWINC